MADSDQYAPRWPDLFMEHFGPFMHQRRGRGRRGRPGPPPFHGPPPPPPPPHHHGPPHPHGPPPWVLDMLGIRPRRAEKGEVRYLILDAIRDEARHGYEIIQYIESRAGGGYKPSPGTVYPTLQMLEEMGHAASSKEGGRRVYEITDEGRADLEAHEDEVEEAYDRLGQSADWVDPGELHALFKRVRRMMHSLGRAFRRGMLGPDEANAVRDALDDAVRRVEEILRESRKR